MSQDLPVCHRNNDKTLTEVQNTQKSSSSKTVLPARINKTISHAFRISHVYRASRIKLHRSGRAYSQTNYVFDLMITEKRIFFFFH